MTSKERMEAYKTFGFSKQALTDENIIIRLEAYKELGWTEEALNDESPLIRYEAYNQLGWPTKTFGEKNAKLRNDKIKKTKTNFIKKFISFFKTFSK